MPISFEDGGTGFMPIPIPRPLAYPMLRSSRLSREKGITAFSRLLNLL